MVLRLGGGALDAFKELVGGLYVRVGDFLQSVGVWRLVPCHFLPRTSRQ